MFICISYTAYIYTNIFTHISHMFMYSPHTFTYILTCFMHCWLSSLLMILSTDTDILFRPDNITSGFHAYHSTWMTFVFHYCLSLAVTTLVFLCIQGDNTYIFKNSPQPPPKKKLPFLCHLVLLNLSSIPTLPLALW